MSIVGLKLIFVTAEVLISLNRIEYTINLVLEDITLPCEFLYKHDMKKKLFAIFAVARPECDEHLVGELFIYGLSVVYFDMVVISPCYMHLLTQERGR